MNELVEIYIDYNQQTHRLGLCRYLAKNRGQSSLFEYSHDWLANPNAFAIDPENLPLRSGPFYTSSDKSALPGALRDTAPDRWGQQLIKRAFRKAGEKRTLSEIDYLLAINDDTRIGALRFKRPESSNFENIFNHTRVSPLIQLPALINAVEAIQTHTETAEDLKLLLNEGSPLGGARPKSAVQDKDGSLIIAKFPKPDDTRSIPHGEVLAMLLAKKANIHVAAARLQLVANKPVALIKRFDRIQQQRIPFLSAMSLLGLNDGDEATYTDIAELIRMYSSQPTLDLHELWRRLVFNVLISNLDDHLRNHGFLYDGQGKWRLSPCYDLNPVPLEEKTKELSTWISEQGPEASIDLAVKAAPSFALTTSQAKSIINEVSSAIKNWKNIARQLGMSAADINSYSSAFI